MISIKLSPPADVAAQLGTRARARRLSKKLTQAGLSQRSGVPLGTLRKFEKTGQISLVSFIRLSMVLGDEAALDRLLRDDRRFNSIEDVLDVDPQPKRGSRG